MKHPAPDRPQKLTAKEPPQLLKLIRGAFADLALSARKTAGGLVAFGEAMPRGGCPGNVWPGGVQRKPPVILSRQPVRIESDRLGRAIPIWAGRDYRTVKKAQEAAARRSRGRWTN